ncbi:hypothetical protein M1437_02975, partial [Patescibacteria group bacterium]|nr:hypothetical protein [Patescibacteria group bacterium]
MVRSFLIRTILYLTLFTLYAVPFTLYPSFTHAQSEGIEVTSVYEVTDTDAVQGDILKVTDKGLVL